MQVELPALVRQKWVDSIKLCRLEKDLEKAKCLLAQLRAQELETHSALGNHLVPMLVECGSLADAQHVFDVLHPHHRYPRSWNALMSGCIDRGNPQDALRLYHQMQEQPHLVLPNLYTFLALLSACTRLEDPETGFGIHVDIIKMGLEADILRDSAVVGNTLVDMYSKCGCLVEAKQVFDGLPVRTAVSWNALLAGYAYYRFGKEAITCFQKMQIEGFPPDSMTFACVLKACGTVGSLEIGLELHSQTINNGMERDLSVGSTLVDMYTKHGLLVEARQVFDNLPLRNAVSWNALIAGYEGAGLDNEVGKCFEHMQLEGISPDFVTLICCLKACITSRALETGQALHGETVKRGLDRLLYLGSTLVDMYTKCNSVAEAHNVFDRLPTRNVILWNSLIAGFAENGLVEEVGIFLQKMQLEGIAPDLVTFMCALKACSIVGSSLVGQGIHAGVTKRGLDNDGCLGNTLVDMYAKCNLLADARQVFDSLPARDAVSWTTLIAGYAEHGRDKETLESFTQMQLAGVFADSVTFLCCLKACSTIGALETGREIHAKVRRSGLDKVLLIGSVLIDMYGKCGSAAEGREVFDQLPSHNVVTWTAMIKAYGDNHEVNLAVQCFEDMQEKGVSPSSVTFMCLLVACSHASLVMKGQEYFKMMIEEKIVPTSEHNACMVDLFARSGHVYEAGRFLAAMDCPPCSVVLMAMLSGCRIYGKVELAESCFQQLVEANQEVAAACLLMEEIYASGGRWSDAHSVEEMRVYSGANKKPGSATIELSKVLHEFFVGVNNQIGDTSLFVDILSSLLKSKEHVPNLDFVSMYIFDDRAEMHFQCIYG